MQNPINERLLSLEKSFKQPELNLLSASNLSDKGIELAVLRLDGIHKAIHGNKWFKLKGNIQRALELGHEQIVSFGGAYSNHLYALANVGEALGIKTVGIVRGEIVEPLNPILKSARMKGMTLLPISRSKYREKDNPEFTKALLEELGPAYVIPEGGANALGVLGCAELSSLIKACIPGKSYTVAMACGTGTTLAGVIGGFEEEDNVSMLGISVLKAQGLIERNTSKWLNEKGSVTPKVEGARRSPSLNPVPCRWEVNDDFHCGGYAKTTESLLKFVEKFQQAHDIPLEPVYTGKLFYGLESLIESDHFPRGSTIVALHTGGIAPI